MRWTRKGGALRYECSECNVAGCMFYSHCDFCLRIFLCCSTSADVGAYVLLGGQEEAHGATAQGGGLFFFKSFVQKPGSINDPLGKIRLYH